MGRKRHAGRRANGRPGPSGREKAAEADKRPSASISTPRIAQLTADELARVPGWARRVHSVPQAATVTVLLVLSIVLYSVGGVRVGTIVSGALFIGVALALWRGEVHLKRAQRDEPGV